MSLTTDRIREFMAARKSKGRANATINRDLEKLSRAYRLAVDERRLAAQFVPMIPALAENNTRTGFFERSDLETLLVQLPEPIDDMARFASIYGWRFSEIQKLGGDAVDMRGREITLADSKNGEGRVLPLDEEDWKLIEKRWSAREYGTLSGPGYPASSSAGTAGP